MKPFAGVVVKASRRPLVTSVESAGWIGQQGQMGRLHTCTDDELATSLLQDFPKCVLTYVLRTLLVRASEGFDLLEIQGVDDGVPVLSATCAGVMSAPPIMPPCDRRQAEPLDTGFDFLAAMHNVTCQAAAGAHAPRTQSARRPSVEEFDFEAALEELIDSSTAAFEKLKRDMRATDATWVQEEEVAEQQDNDEAAETELLLEAAPPTAASLSSPGPQDGTGGWDHWVQHMLVLLCIV